MLPRSLRNLNPGNVRPRSAGLWPGQVGLDTNQPDPPYCRFATARDGFDCLASVLIGYGTHGTRTARSIIGVWAPAGDHNAPSSYAQAVASALHVTVDTPLNLHDAATLHALATVIARVEGSSAWADADIVAGVAAALARSGQPAAIVQAAVARATARGPAGQPEADALDLAENPVA